MPIQKPIYKAKLMPNQEKITLCPAMQNSLAETHHNSIIYHCGITCAITLVGTTISTPDALSAISVTRIVLTGAAALPEAAAGAVVTDSSAEVGAD